VELLEGQAQFSVAHDPQRPFKVQVGERTVIALGTKFTVEYIDHEFRIAMLEGRVAVISDLSPVEVTAKEQQTADMGSHSSAPREREMASAAKSLPSDNTAPTIAAHFDGDPAGVIELSAGEGLQIDRGGRSILIPKADLRAVNAWREGKVIFNAEPLQEAIRRLNRYSSLRIEISDPALASMRVSGVFDAGDAHAFVEAVQHSIAVEADYSEPSTIRLRAR
jgi:transmembrane sensor